EASIILQKAEKDFKTAEFYRRTGHPGPAYFCYEIVRRSYPGTKYSTMAAERMNELRARLIKEQGGVPQVPPAPARPAAPAQAPAAWPPPRPLPSVPGSTPMPPAPPGASGK